MGVKMRDVPDDEHLSLGNLACAGCPEVLGFRHVLKMLGPETIVINATGCLAVVMQMGVPKVPHFHVLFENAPAVISGIDDGLKAMEREKKISQDQERTGLEETQKLHDHYIAEIGKTLAVKEEDILTG